ncbi:BapA/Bap/LapF family large adhesin [Acinetobacter indicus]|uniref:BapA/Bap/LapF family large adhesin n=1 Tax=Acinetobacter indicus TaxID=756892 RepID=UPI000CECCEC0|nr:BapA/Bap/LapF family large adhesin [Acinetobacter indicus]
MGDLNHTTVKYASVSNVAVVDIGLINNDVAGANFTTVQHAEENTDVIVTVSQQNLLAVASGFSVEVVRVEADGSLTTVKVATVNDGLVADALGLSILGVVDDGNTVAIKLEDLPEGDYRVIVKNDESVINDLIGGLTLNELGDQGVVLGKDNQELVLNTVETALNGKYGLGLGTAVKTLLSGLLATTDTLGAGDIVRALKESTIVGPLLNTLLGGLVDPILDVIADALVDNLISVLRTTNVEISGEESHFSKLSITDNVLDNDVDPSDTAVVTSVNGTAVTAEGVNIEGLYGTLTIQANGQYTYTAHDSLSSTGKVETFTYSISDGVNSDTAKLVINIKDGIAPDAAIVDPVNGSSDITGTAEPGSTVIVTFPDGTQPASASVVVGADGTWTIANPGLQDASEIIVTVKDSFGNTSEPTTIVVDALAPDAPMAHFSEAGDTVSGTAEPGSTVQVKDKDGNVLGTAEADEDGNYTVELEDPLNDGEVVDVTATDAANNESDPTEITAPNIVVEAVDNLAEAQVNFEYPVSETQVNDIIDRSWLINIGSISDSGYFSVGENQISNAVITISTRSLLDLFDNATIGLYKEVSPGNWEQIADNSSSGLLDLLGIFGESTEIGVNGLTTGNYRLDFSGGSLIGVGGYLNVDIHLTNYDTSAVPEVTGVTPVEGNVITDTDDNYGQDNVPTGAIVSEVNGQEVIGETTIPGDHGTLVIHPDGSYTYTPNSDVTVIGKTEVFEYTVTDPVTGKSDTANLIIQIGTNSDLDLTWDAENPTANAETVVATDNADLIGVDATNLVDPTVAGPQISESWLISLSATPRTVQSGVITVNENTISNIEVGLSTSSLLGLGGSASVAFQKLVGGVWVTQDTISASSLADLIALFPNGNGKVYENQEAGQYRFELNYTRGAGIAGNVTVSTGVTTIHLDDFIATPIDSVVGNVYTDDDGAGTDILASIYTDLFVSTDGGVTWTQVTSTGTDFVGNHGTLSIKSDGSYTYNVTDSGLAGGASDEFTYKLVAPNGGADTVIFDLLDNADALGGNGHDTWTDFNLAEGDKIDITELLAGQTVDGDNIGQFVTVTQVGNDTVISIYRDGTASTSYNPTELLTLQNTNTTLQDLLDNNQLLF